ncbi:MAG: T9SS type A sorting domain-containing protein, partial [bacterium]|nr:T9SS type A sorting domain-containing protein [bacterium]
WIKTCPIFVDADHNELSFWLMYELETGYDFVYLDVSVDGGAWVQKDIFSGTKLDWTMKKYDLSAYTGDIIEVRFRFSSDNNLALEGFYFDDVLMAEQTSDIDSVAFSGEAVDEGILLTWRPDNPAEITGVNILREEKAGYVRLNETPLAVGRYLDLDISPESSHRYELETLGVDGSRSLYGPIEVSGSGAGARVTRLDPCYPCPAGTFTTIPFTLAADGTVRIDVYDLAGRLVQTVARGEFTAGRHEVPWGTESVANGVYLIRLTGGGTTATQRIVVSR